MWSNYKTAKINGQKRKSHGNGWKNCVSLHFPLLLCFFYLLALIYIADMTPGAQELSLDLFSLVDPIDPDDLVNIPELNMTPMMNPANEGSGGGLSTAGIGE